MSNSELDLLILKSIINSKKNALEFTAECDDRLFDKDVWNFAKIVINHINTYKDVPTLRVLTEKVKNNESLVKTITDTWNKVQSVNYDEKDYKFDLDKLKKRFVEKQILELKDNLNNIDFSKIDLNKNIGALKRVLHDVDSVSHKKTYEKRSLKEGLQLFVDKYNYKRQNPDFNVGFKTGYSYLDSVTNGLRGSDFLLVAGESGHGKSLLLSNMSIQLWLQDNKIGDSEFKPGLNILYISLEMPYENCFNRILSRLSGVPYKKIDGANLNKEEMVKVKLATDFIKNYPNHFDIVDIPNCCANDIEAIFEDLSHDHVPDVIVIDYLGIMEQNHKGSEDQDWLKQGIISAECRFIGRKYNIPIMTAVQLNRKAASSKETEAVGLHRLARSATIASHATTVLQLVSRPEEEKYSDMKISVIKNRNGKKGEFSVIKDMKCSNLIDIPVEAGDDGEFKEYNSDDISDVIDKIEL